MELIFVILCLTKESPSPHCRDAATRTGMHGLCHPVMMTSGAYPLLLSQRPMLL